MTISIKSGNTGGAFSISGSDLILATALDYEVTQFYDLLIEAVDGGTPTPLTSQVKLVDLGGFRCTDTHRDRGWWHPHPAHLTGKAGGFRWI